MKYIPRIIFESKDDVSTWCDVIGKNKSTAYITEKGEIILVPNKSTRPLMFGYWRGDDTSVDKSQRIENAKQILIECAVPFFIVKSFDWSEDRALQEESPLREYLKKLKKS